MNESPTPKRKSAKAAKAPHFEDAKRNPFKKRMTSAGRANKHRKTKQHALTRLSFALGHSDDPGGQRKRQPQTELLNIAAARLESVGKGDALFDFSFAAESYLHELRWESGNSIPVDSYWEQLLRLVGEVNTELAQTFAAEFKLPFRWCILGHVQRLHAEYTQRPEAVQTIEIYQKRYRKRHKTTLVAVRRDGTRFVLRDPDYPRKEPWVCLAGTFARPPLAVADYKRLLGLNPKHALSLLKSGKFKFTHPKPELFTRDTVFNVAKPRELDRVRLFFRSFGFKPSFKLHKS